MINAQMKKGLLDVCVLATLNRGESYGYRILKDLPQCLEVSESTLYPILRRLEGSNCLSSHSVEHEGRLRKMYQITPEGKRQILSFLEDGREFQEILRYIKEGAEHE